MKQRYAFWALQEDYKSIKWYISPLINNFNTFDTIFTKSLIKSCEDSITNINSQEFYFDIINHVTNGTEMWTTSSLFDGKKIVNIFPEGSLNDNIKHLSREWILLDETSPREKITELSKEFHLIMYHVDD